MNVSDTELVFSILTNNNIEISDSIDDADIIIFNTCSVRQHAEERVIGRINNEMSRKSRKQDLKIGVIGCMAQRLGEKLIERNKGIDFVVGTDQYRKLPEIITNLFVNPQFKKNIIINNKEMYDGLYPIHKGNFNAFATIMRGCNNFCSYCIVPYVRGRERSRDYRDIIKEVEELGKKNFKEITLLGQNVNSYNYKGLNFAELLKRVNRISSIERIRFVTSHPKDLSKEVIAIMKDSAKICEHIHLPVQSGDNKILKKMNRGYTVEHYSALVDSLRKALPGISITTDIITGFPGESEKQFQNTLDLMTKIEFDYAFTFKYSPRSGTEAANYNNQIPEEERLARLQKLISLQEKITLKKYKDQIGKIKEIYVEKVSKKSKLELSGKSRDYKITVFPGDESLIGKFVNVLITEATGWTLKGKLFDEQVKPKQHNKLCK